MKKTTAFFLVIGVLAMIGGGIGAATFYHRAENTMITHKKEEHVIKNKKALKEVHLNLSGNANYKIQTEASDKVLMETSFGTSSTIESSLKVEEKTDRLNISTSGNQSNTVNNKFRIGFFFDEFNPTVTITIPENAEKIIVEGAGAGDVSFEGVGTKDLAIDLNHSDLFFNQVNTETLDIKLSTGDINLYGDTRSKKISAVTNYGDLELVNLSVEKLNAKTGTGDIYLSEVNGVSTIETNLGDVTVSNLKGDATFTIGTGSFDLTGNDLPKKLKVTANLGDISIETDEILYNTSITATSSLGDVEIFGNEKTGYSNGKADRSFELSTKTGDISVDGPSDHEEN